MFVSIKLTPARLLAIVTAVLCVILTIDAVKQSQKPTPLVLASDFDRARYLKQQGLNVDPEPIWSKQVVISETPDESLSAYIAVLQQQGFSVDEHIGEKLDIYCYRCLDDTDVYARVLMNGDEFVGADKFVLGNDTVSMPLYEN